MLDHIRQYYLDEKANAIPVFIAATPLLVLGMLLCFKYGSNALAKGMGTGFLVITVLLLGMGIGTMIYNTRKIDALSTLAPKSDQDLRANEMQRMDKVMNSTFRNAFRAFGALMLAAMAVIILAKSDHWRGLGIALMVLVALAVVFDSFNMRRNREYQRTITELAV